MYTEVLPFFLFMVIFFLTRVLFHAAVNRDDAEKIRFLGRWLRISFLCLIGWLVLSFIAGIIVMLAA